MLGLINRSIQCFVRDTYGEAAWNRIAGAAGLGFTSFEALMTYPDEMTQRVVETACEVLSKPRDTLLEDMGTYLVSTPEREGVRRLLRFGGETFVDFLFSLEDLQARARLAVPGLVLPEISTTEHANGNLTIRCRSCRAGFGYVMMGVLRAMADDYGALVFLEYAGVENGEEVVSVQLLDAAFAEARSFTLAPGGA